MAKPVELYVTMGCPYSASAREDLEWRGIDFVEYDVERDREAYERMLDLTGGNRRVQRSRRRSWRRNHRTLKMIRVFITSSRRIYFWCARFTDPTCTRLRW
jgi:glutaredoxin-related protein